MSTQPLPRVLSVIEVVDYGPSDGAGSASCPHCGASGRYVVRFLCADGLTHAAMRGCFKLFPKADDRVAYVTNEAIKRAAEARPTGARLASWWRDVLDLVEALREDKIDFERFRAYVLQADGRRREWLRRKGYGRRGRR